MGTTFHVTNFKNQMLNLLTGLQASNSNSNQAYYVMPYNGTQPADPSATPVGVSCVSSYSYAPVTYGYMTASANGVSNLSATRPSNTTGTTAQTALTFARITGSSGWALVDTPVSLSGGGGGVILDVLNTTAGVSFNVTQFSIKFPTTNGATIFLSQTLADWMVNILTGSTTASIYFGASTSGTSVLTIYGGTPPANADAVQSNTPLCSFTFGSQNFAAAASGSAALTGSLTTAAAANSGTATHFRWVKTVGSTTYTIQGSAGTAATDLIINTTTIVATNTYTISNLTISI